MLTMGEMPSRREELIAGALTGSLSDAEWQELDQARAADPTIDAELAELRATASRLDAADLSWREEALPASLEERIRAATSESEEEPGRDSDDGHPSSGT